MLSLTQSELHASPLSSFWGVSVFNGTFQPVNGSCLSTTFANLSSCPSSCGTQCVTSVLFVNAQQNALIYEVLCCDYMPLIPQIALTVDPYQGPGQEWLVHVRNIMKKFESQSGFVVGLTNGGGYMIDIVNFVWCLLLCCC